MYRTVGIKVKMYPNSTQRVLLDSYLDEYVYLYNKCIEYHYSNKILLTPRMSLRLDPIINTINKIIEMLYLYTRSKSNKINVMEVDKDVYNSEISKQAGICNVAESVAKLGSQLFYIGRSNDFQTRS